MRFLRVFLGQFCLVMSLLFLVQSIALSQSIYDCEDFIDGCRGAPTATACALL
ncbi:MAG: hypothetical protein KatS3mg111_4265 [Pirellulaceae bacterium]|nr:MAG: hypothetical protein KatS3mg111_4265 [Pirellulaceae bacterium]